MVKRVQLSIMCHVSPLVAVSSISPLLSSSQLDEGAHEVSFLDIQLDIKPFGSNTTLGSVVR